MAHHLERASTNAGGQQYLQRFAFDTSLRLDPGGSHSSDGGAESGSGQEIQPGRPSLKIQIFVRLPKNYNCPSEIQRQRSSGSLEFISKIEDRLGRKIAAL